MKLGGMGQALKKNLLFIIFKYYLIQCSLSSPGNIPFVLSGPSTLYKTRSGGYQTELILPLGMVVNAVFKNQNWLYVQTPHADEGYISYAACLPLGILPQQRYKFKTKQQLKK